MTYNNSGGVLRLQAVMANRKYRASEQPGSQKAATTTTPTQQSPATQKQVGSLSANPQSPASQRQAPQSGLSTSAPKQDQMNPVYNNAPTSSANNQYPFDASKQRAQEPITTDRNGTQSSQPVPMAEADQRMDNKGNLQVAEQQGYKPVNYEEMVNYTQKQANKDFNKMAAYTGISRLGAMLSGANADYQAWWR